MHVLEENDERLQNTLLVTIAKWLDDDRSLPEVSLSENILLVFDFSEEKLRISWTPLIIHPANIPRLFFVLLIILITSEKYSILRIYKIN